jgi:hypothetical protein
VGRTRLVCGHSTLTFTGRIAHFDLTYIPESNKQLKELAGFRRSRRLSTSRCRSARRGGEAGSQEHLRRAQVGVGAGGVGGQAGDAPQHARHCSRALGDRQHVKQAIGDPVAAIALIDSGLFSDSLQDSGVADTLTDLRLRFL